MQSSFTLKFNKEKIFTVGMYIVLFLLLLHPYSDYDWGWHYRYGEHVIKTGQIMREDVWSWTAPGYAWVNHEWLYDPLVYVVTNAFGFPGFSILGALVALLAFYFSTKGIKLGFVEKGVLAFFFWYLVSGVLFQGLRAQIIGLLLIAINMYLIRKSLYDRTRAFLLFPLFFLFWVNMHGSFILGLALLGLSIIQSAISHFRVTSEGFKLDTYTIRYAIAGVLSVIATLVNPFTYQVYLEALRHFNNPLLHMVMEWTPVDFPSVFYLAGIVYVLLLVGFMLYRYKKVGFRNLNYFEVISSILVIYLAFTARRYVAIMVVVTLPFLAYYISKTPVQWSRYKTSTIFMVVALLIAIQIGGMTRLFQLGVLTPGLDAYCARSSRCSGEAVEYLKKNPPAGLGFNFYDWGGYLIGQGFPAKLFIDGRMHLWRTESGFQPMEDYTRIYYRGDVELFKRYEFDWVLIPKGIFLDTYIADGKAGDFDVAYEDATTIYYIRDETPETEEEALPETIEEGVSQ